MAHGRSAASNDHRNPIIGQPVRFHHELEESCEAPLILRDLAAVAIHQRELERDQGSQFTSLQNTEVDPAQQVKGLRTRIFRSNDLWNARVDSETLDEGAPVGNFFK